MLASRPQGKWADLAEVAAQVTEVLADLISLAPPDEGTALMAVLPANLGGLVPEKCQESDPTTLCAVRAAVGGRRSRSRENALMALDNVPRPSHVLTVGS
jgi:hypothetical protein